MGGPSLIQVYNECDVVELALKVRPDRPLPEDIPLAGSSSSGPSSGALAEKDGPRIMRTTAMNEFKVRVD